MSHLNKAIILLLIMEFSGCATRKTARDWYHHVMPSGGNAYALLIGINEYNHGKLDRLQKPKFEASTLAEILSAQGCSTRVLSDSAATRENVLEHLYQLTQNKFEVDRILVYFSGHGMDFTGLQGRMPDEILQEMYADEIKAINQARNKSERPEYMILALYQDQEDFRDVIGAHEIIAEFNRSSAHQKILIIDACYSGSLTEFTHFAIPVYSPRVIEDGLFAITGVKEPTLDGAYSPLLFSGLQGAADKRWAGNRDGCVSVYELAVFMDGELLAKSWYESGTINKKIRYVLIGSGEIQVTCY